MKITRRRFVRSTALAAAATQLATSLRSADAPSSTRVVSPASSTSSEPVELLWLDGSAPKAAVGATVGVPWPRGKLAAHSPLSLRTKSGQPVPIQTWPLATWPDGSLKWTAHALPANIDAGDGFLLAPGTSTQPTPALRLTDGRDDIQVETGVMTCRVAKRGTSLITSIFRDNREILREGRLVCLREDRSEPGVQREQLFTGEIKSAVIEQSGPVRGVVRLEGNHVGPGGRGWLPFTVRLYFYAGGETVRVMHTFVFDGNEASDFIRGLGVRFAVPMRDALHDRHVRFVGDGDGVFGEGVRNLTGLRRDPGPAAKAAQLAGTATPAVSTFPRTVSSRLELIPAFGDYTLLQANADGFELRKRTKEGHAWISSGHGRRAPGLGYVGGITGGVAFGLHDFWQRHPTALDIRHAATDRAEVTAWLWSPDAPAMDLRFYHDGLGMDTYPRQLEGLEITYEDYEPGFGTPQGVARTSELMLWALPATPPRERLLEMAAVVREPPVLRCRPEHYHSAQIFGAVWGLPNRTSPTQARLEDQLDWFFRFYHQQVEERHWYGFWNYGDVMHTYDFDRHTWRYDVGGFAWDNSELSTDLWLWYAYLRSGRADIFRFAEAMTRHTGEVDVHHLGQFAGLGSRHNVMHWGCSAKQARISTAANRRFYYYLTGDERVGDLLREQLETDRKITEINARRKVAGDLSERNPWPAMVSIGTDWCSLASAWLTEWERTGDIKWRDKLLTGMRSVGASPAGWFSIGWGYEPTTGVLHVLEPGVTASHLECAFGAFEISAELLQLIDEPGYARAWLQYCELYNASDTEQTKALGKPPGGRNLVVGHSRLTAYASIRKKDPALAQRAWVEFNRENQPGQGRPTMQSTRIEGPAVLDPVTEARGVSTNDAAQWCLAAIHNLGMLGPPPPDLV